jgi:autotransporter passenger strand-loop-strand repeat protein
MSDGTQDVYGNGTVDTMSGGKQDVEFGCNGTVTTMSGGKQDVEDGGKGTVTTMSGGEQIVKNGGSGTVVTMSGRLAVYFCWRYRHYHSPERRRAVCSGNS